MKRPLNEGLTHDWYCFECHSCNQNELVIDCETCFRVFHKSCIKDQIIREEFECIYCLKIKQIQNNKSLRINAIEKPLLNKLLSFVLRNLSVFVESDLYLYFAFKESHIKSKSLIFKSLDLLSIEHKIKNNVYNYVQEFENDFKHFIHNYKVSHLEYFDDDYKLVNKIHKRFNREISELKLCIDCYNYSNNYSFDDIENPYDWFALVCNPPHECLFAKSRGYGFWPSKVISISDDGQTYDVRYFNAPQFERDFIPIDRLKSIEYKTWDRSQKMKSALSLLQKHLNNLKEKGVNFETTITDSKISSEEQKFIKTENSSKAKVTTSSGYKTKFNNHCIQVLNDSTNHSLQSFSHSDHKESHSFDSQSQQRQENDSQTLRRSKRVLQKKEKSVISKKKKKVCDRHNCQNIRAFKQNVSFDSGLDSMDGSLVESIEYLSDILAEDVENNFDSGFH